MGKEIYRWESEKFRTKNWHFEGSRILTKLAFLVRAVLGIQDRAVVHSRWRGCSGDVAGYQHVYIKTHAALISFAHTSLVCMQIINEPPANHTSLAESYSPRCLAGTASETGKLLAILPCGLRPIPSPA